MSKNKALNNKFLSFLIFSKKKLLQERKLQQHLPLSTMPISKNSEKKEPNEYVNFRNLVFSLTYYFFVLVQRDKKRYHKKSRSTNGFSMVHLDQKRR